MKTKLYVLTLIVLTMLYTSCSNDNDSFSNIDEMNYKTMNRQSIDGDSIIELDENDFPKIETNQARSMPDPNIRNELYQLNGMNFFIQSVNYGFGNNTLEFTGKGKELKLSPYSSSNNKQKFHFEFPSSASGVNYFIYSSPENIPIGVGSYASKPNQYVLYAKGSGNLFACGWNFYYNNTKDSYVIVNTDIFAAGSGWLLDYFAITSDNGKLSMSKHTNSSNQQFTIIPDDEFEIRSVELLHNEGKILESIPYLLEANWINNPGYSTSITHNYNYSKALTDNTSFQEQKAITATKTQGFNINLVLSKVVTLGGSSSLAKGEQQTLIYGTSQTQTTQISKTYNFVVAPRISIKYKLIATKSTLDVPYIATLKGIKSKKEIKIRGIWNGVDYSSTYFDIEEYNLDNLTQIKNKRRIYLN